MEEGSVPAPTPAQRRAREEEDADGVGVGGRRHTRRACAVLVGGFALVLAVAAVARSSSGARPSALSPWADDPELAKMQDTIASLSQTLDSTKHELRRAAAQRREDARAQADSRKYLRGKDHALRVVFEHPEQYASKQARDKLAASLQKAVPAAAALPAGGAAAALGVTAPPKPAAAAPRPVVSLRIVGSLTAALKVLQDSKLTPVQTRKLATLTMSAVKAQLQALESGVDCSRKAEYDKLLTHFGTLLEQLRMDDKTRTQMDAEKKATMDQAVAEFQKVQKAYNDSTARLAEAQEHEKTAHDNFVRYKTVVEELKKEEARIESRLSTVDADSKTTLSELATLKTYIDEMQHAIDTGAEDVWAARRLSATASADRLITSDANKEALKTGLNSPSKPKEMTADVVKSIEDEAKAGASGLNARMATVKEALANAQRLYQGYQMDYITFSTDVDVQRELQRAAHAELARLDGEQMAATWAYQAWRKEYSASDANADKVTSATQEVIAKLADGLASCTQGAAAASPSTSLQSAAAKIRQVGKAALGHQAQRSVKSGGKPRVLKGKAVDGQKLAGDPVLYKEPGDLNDKSDVEGIAQGSYPALGEKAPDALDASQMGEFDQAVGEANEEHKLDQPGLGLPKHAQWINSWARKTPGAMVIHPLHLSGLDKQILAMRPVKSHR